MAKRLIGYATTDSNGVATINYIGQGLGELSITAETGGEMLFQYIGTGGTETDQFVYNTTDIQVSTSSTGTTVTNNGSVGRTYWANKSGTSTNVDVDWNVPITVEFDVVSYTGNATGISFQLVVSTPSTIAVSKNFNDLGITSNNHIKIVYDGSEVKWYVDDVLKYTQSYSQSNFIIRFYIVNGNSVKFKNFFIYKSSSTLVSEPYTLLDCTFVDWATSSDYNNNWGESNMTFVRNTSDTTLSMTDTTKTNGICQVEFLNNYCAEVDIKTSSKSDFAFSIRKGSSNYNQSAIGDMGCNNNTYYHFKITCINGTLTYYRDGTNVRERTISTDHNYLVFRLQKGATCNYKNFKVYPI